MGNPIKAMYDYYEKSGVRRDLPWLKRMFVEIPHVPIGLAVMVTCITGSAVYLTTFYDAGVGFQERYTVMRPGDPRLAKYRQDVINADKLSGK